MSTIKFERFKRECGANENLKPGQVPIYDFAIYIDGEYRARWTRSSCRGRGYSLIANTKGVYHPIARDEPRQSWTKKNPIQNVNQKDFLVETEKALAEGLIPTVAGLLELEAAHKAKLEQQATDQAASNRQHRMEAKALEMFSIICDGIRFPHPRITAVLDYIDPK